MAIKKVTKSTCKAASSKTASKPAAKSATAVKKVAEKKTCKSTCKSSSCKQAQPIMSLIVTQAYEYSSNGFKRVSGRALKFASASKKGAPEFLVITPRLNRRFVGRVISAAISLNAKAFDIKQVKNGNKGYKVIISSGTKSAEIVTKTKIFDI